jgi:hypothetical protein
MSLYKYVGNVFRSDGTTRIVFKSSTGSTVAMDLGQTADLTPEDLGRLSLAYKFTDSTNTPVTPIDPGGGGGGTTTGGGLRTPVATVDLLPATGNTVGDLRVVLDLMALYVWSGTFWGLVVASGSGGGGSGSLTQATVDTGALFKAIYLSDTTVRAIPVAAIAPATPSGLAATASIGSIGLSWSSAARATSYRVIRNGSLLATVTNPAYRDVAVAVGSTYTYSVQSVDQYGERSPVSGTVSAFVDPSFNHAPVADIRTYPATAPSNGYTILRLNGFDSDIQNLAMMLGVDTGTLQATEDPSVWLLAV